MAGDYIPGDDAGFNTMQNGFFTYLNANLLPLGLTPLDPDVVALGTAHTNWGTGYPAAISAQAAAVAANATKDAERAALEAVIRRLATRLQASSIVTNAQRAALGLTVRDTTHTPVTAPTSKPVLQADTSQRLRITISFADEGDPTSKAKPAGVIGAEIWMKHGGPPPTDLSECTFLALDTKTPYTAEFDGSDANATAHFIARWVSTRGDKGPLSETVSATVPG